MNNYSAKNLDQGPPCGGRSGLMMFHYFCVLVG